MPFDSTILFVASLTFFIGGVSKGVMGFGLPWIAIPMLTAFGSLPLALSIAVPPVVATNLWQLWKFRAHRDVPLIVRFMMPGVIGLVIGAIVLKSINNAYLEIILGVSVLFFLVSQKRSASTVMPAEQRNKLAPIFGGLAGAAHGALGLSGLVGPPFFHASGLARPAFIYSTSLMFTIFSVLHMPALAAVGLFQSSALFIGCLATIPAFGGVWIGSILGDRLKSTTFPVLVKGMLIIAAILPVWNGLSNILMSS